MIDFNELIKFAIGYYAFPQIIVEDRVLIDQWAGFKQYTDTSNNTIRLNVGIKAVKYLTIDKDHIYTEMSVKGVSVPLTIPMYAIIGVMNADKEEPKLNIRRSNILDHDLLSQYEKQRNDVPVESVPQEIKTTQRHTSYVDDTFTVEGNPLKLIKGGRYHHHHMLNPIKKETNHLKIVKG